jgi:hypothetical protein
MPSLPERGLDTWVTKANRRRLGQGLTSRVATIQTDPNVFSTTIAKGGGGGRRRREKWMHSPHMEYGSQGWNQVSGPGDT